jgi:hypothetical protein
MLDTRTYEIEVPDGCSDEYTANVIAENMYAQCDSEGNQYNLMESIIDHKMDGHIRLAYTNGSLRDFDQM